MRRLETVRLLYKFNNLRQKQGMSIGEFKKLFDDQILILARAGVPDREESELAMVFLSKLDGNLRNFVIAQGYDVGPAIIFQDNMSCMALMKRGGPGSERSRHIKTFLAQRKSGSG